MLYDTITTLSAAAKYKIPFKEEAIPQMEESYMKDNPVNNIFLPTKLVINI